MKRTPKTFFVVAGLLALLAAQPSSSLACAACAGDPDSAMTHALSLAIAFLVGTVGCVLTGLTLFFVNANKNAALSSPRQLPVDNAPTEN